MEHFIQTQMRCHKRKNKTFLKHVQPWNLQLKCVEVKRFLWYFCSASDNCRGDAQFDVGILVRLNFYAPAKLHRVWAAVDVHNCQSTQLWYDESTQLWEDESSQLWTAEIAQFAWKICTIVNHWKCKTVHIQSFQWHWGHFKVGEGEETASHRILWWGFHPIVLEFTALCFIWRK